MSCDQIAATFRNAHIRQEYGVKTRSNIGYDEENGYFDLNDQPIADHKWTTTTKPSGAPPNADAPPFAPFYFGIKEGDQEAFRGDNAATKAALDALRNLTMLPYFMDEVNEFAVRDSPEFWMGANGTGAKAHADNHCYSTISLQLSGKRRWRLDEIPADVKASDVNIFGDGVVYTAAGSAGSAGAEAGREPIGSSSNGAGWQPLFSLEISAGEALVFPPGFIHETTNIGGSCAVSLTHQFDVPLPMGYFRQFLRRLMRVGDLKECRPLVHAHATLGYGYMPRWWTESGAYDIGKDELVGGSEEAGGEAGGDRGASKRRNDAQGGALVKGAGEGAGAAGGLEAGTGVGVGARVGTRAVRGAGAGAGGAGAGAGGKEGGAAAAVAAAATTTATTAATDVATAADTTAARKLAIEIAYAVDGNKDETLSIEELAEFIAGKQTRRRESAPVVGAEDGTAGVEDGALMKNSPSDLHTLPLILDVADVFNYHDVDGDGVVSTGEFIRNFVEWGLVIKEAQQNIAGVTSASSEWQEGGGAAGEAGVGTRRELR
jgi:hypothetical protein